jgi:hypothetical protein
MRYVFYGGVFGQAISVIVANGIADDRLNKAVNNYNLTVMGIPLPPVRK